MRRTLTTLAPIALVAVALLASGCNATLDPVASAATRTARVSTMRFAMEITVSDAAQGRSAAIGVDGAVDLARHRFRLTLDAARAVTGVDPVGRVTVVEDGAVMYLSGGALAGRLPGGKTWVRVDLSRIPGAPGFDLSELTGGQTDPRSSLAQLRHAGNVVRIGPDRVDGVPATRYSVLVDLEQGVRARDAAARAVVDRLEASGQRYVPADAWVDAEGYVRKVRLQLSNYLGTGASFALTLRLFGFGDPVGIELPAPALVADLTSRLG